MARWRNLVAMGAAAALTGALVAPVAAAAGPEFVKFYRVTDGRDGGKTLNEISRRLLGDPARARDILALNAGRRQADGGSLRADGRLACGWVLTLPWDAAGAGVRYGELPAGSARNAGCDKRETAADWVEGQLSVLEAWARTRGGGVVVAVIDSGVDGRLPELAGRVSVGADVTGGSRGDTDKLGSGTALARRIAAGDDGRAGLAPEATILPVRALDAKGAGDPAQAASAIEAAVTAGARVIALGPAIDVRTRQVALAVDAAVDHDVVVVAGAAVRHGSADESGPGYLQDGLLLVGGVDADGQPTTDLITGGIDVVAPDAPAAGAAAKAAPIGIVAGTVVLVRAAWPALTAREVTRRVRDTARAGALAGDDQVGQVDPAAALRLVAADPPRRTETNWKFSGGWWALILLFIVAPVLAAGLAVVELRTGRSFRQRFRRSSAAPALGADPDRDDDPTANLGT